MKIGTNGNNQAGTVAFLVAKLICAPRRCVGARPQAALRAKLSLRLLALAARGGGRDPIGRSHLHQNPKDDRYQ
jgi:hypothetical protein